MHHTARNLKQSNSSKLSRAASKHKFTHNDLEQQFQQFAENLKTTTDEYNREVDDESELVHKPGRKVKRGVERDLNQHNRVRSALYNQRRAKGGIATGPFGVT